MVGINMIAYCPKCGNENETEFELQCLAPGTIEFECLECNAKWKVEIEFFEEEKDLEDEENNKA